MRVKRGTKARRRRNKVLDRASGYQGAGSRVFSVAKERNDRALVFAYRDRKTKKREFRRLWIARISAAAKLNGTSYSKFMGALIKSPIEMDRKVLSDMAIFDPAAFTQLLHSVMPSSQA